MHRVRVLIAVHDGQRLRDRKSDYKTITILRQLKMRGSIRYRFFIIFTSSFSKHGRLIIADHDSYPTALEASASFNAFDFRPLERYANLRIFMKTGSHSAIAMFRLVYLPINLNNYSTLLAIYLSPCFMTT